MSLSLIGKVKLRRFADSPTMNLGFGVGGGVLTPVAGKDTIQEGRPAHQPLSGTNGQEVLLVNRSSPGGRSPAETPGPALAQVGKPKLTSP